MTPDVLIYTTSWCPYCVRAKTLLIEKGVEFNEIDIDADPFHRQVMMETSGRSSVPQIFVNGTHVGGCDDLFDLEGQGKLDTLLALKPPAS